MKTGIKIIDVEYAGDYKLAITFSDKTINLFDYKSLVTLNHEGFRKYLDVTKFKKFKVVNNRTAIAWGKNWEMILPLYTLYYKRSTVFKTNNPKK